MTPEECAAASVLETMNEYAEGTEIAGKDPEVRVTREKGGEHGRTLADAGYNAVTGKCIITFYWGSIEEQLGAESTGEVEKDVEKAFNKGLIASVGIHELIHCCEDKAAGQHIPAGGRTSCKHQWIDFSASCWLCTHAGNLKSLENAPGATPAEIAAAKATRKAMCKEIARLRATWHNGFNRRFLRACFCCQIAPKQPDEGDDKESAPCALVRVTTANDESTAEDVTCLDSTGNEIQVECPFDFPTSYIPVCEFCTF